jgi:hypothetical protein
LVSHNNYVASETSRSTTAIGEIAPQPAQAQNRYAVGSYGKGAVEGSRILDQRPRESNNAAQTARDTRKDAHQQKPRTNERGYRQKVACQRNSEASM